MSKFTNKETGVVVSVADHKDERFSSDVWDVTVDDETPAKKSRAATDSK
jgi:hypothetical protein